MSCANNIDKDGGQWKENVGRIGNRVNYAVGLRSQSVVGQLASDKKEKLVTRCASMVVQKKSALPGKF